MRFYDIIEKKKRGEALCREEIFSFVSGYTDGSIPDYQASALLMAIYFRGMTDEETTLLTEAIEGSGDRLDLSAFGERTVDKHSTGGVGDKTTLVAAPIACAAGATVAKMSGRGLGHTGGTVDKLEAIPGYRCALSAEEFQSQVKDIRISVISQSGNLAPADKRIYALRDVTATVDSIPLIASSIMGKKLATSTRSLVLDVKWGDGAFMKSPEEAERLARLMVSIGRRRGRNCTALITDMNQPLGNAVGNAIEVREAIDTLRGEGPQDLREISLELAAHMISLSMNTDLAEARVAAERALTEGAALEVFLEWIRRQGGCADFALRKEFGYEAAYSSQILAEEDGYISECFAERIGIAAMALGAGRAKKDDGIDMAAGILLLKKCGDRVLSGEPVARLFTSDKEKLPSAEEIARSAFRISRSAPEQKRLIAGIIR